MLYEDTTPLSHPCFHCTRESPAFDWHRSCANYDEPVNTLLYGYKYSSHLDLKRLFVEWMVNRNRKLLEGTDYLIPVPLARQRLKMRTYNQSLELAKGIARQVGGKVLYSSIVKVRETPPQTGLKRSERIDNLRGAFTWSDKKNYLEGSKVILIDDVYTTGSTLSACARVLRRQRPREIGALTIAINTGQNIASPLQGYLR